MGPNIQISQFCFDIMAVLVYYFPNYQNIDPECKHSKLKRLSRLSNYGDFQETGLSSVFSPNFSLTGKRPFMASKGKNMHQWCTFLGGGGSGVRDMAHPHLKV